MQRSIKFQVGKDLRVRWPATWLGACLLIVSALAQAQDLPMIPQFGIMVRDYSGNIQATDRVWFYLDEYADPQTAGGGVHPGVEYDIRDYPYSRPGPQVSGVVYVLGETSIQVAVTIRNDYGEPVTGSFSVEGARLKVPPQNPASEDWDYESLSVSPTSAQTINLPNLGNEVTFNYTFEGLPEHVFLGLLEVK